MLLKCKKTLAFAALTLLLPNLPLSASGARPFYNINHMVNSLSEIDAAMRQGANAIESDVTFDRNGNATYFYHGTPCDCFRTCLSWENVPTFLQYIRQSTHPDGGKYREKLLLLFLDLKVQSLENNKKYWAGTDIAMKLLRNLWQGVPPTHAMNVLLSVETVRDKEVLRGAIETIKRHEPALLSKTGFDIVNPNTLSDAGNLYRELGVRGNRWQGDGITNCLSFMLLPERARNIIYNRDLEDDERYVDKAYRWTIDVPEQLRSTLRRSTDAIITNKSDRLARILKENEFRGKLRPATIHDSPWTRIRGSPPGTTPKPIDFAQLTAQIIIR